MSSREDQAKIYFLKVLLSPDFDHSDVILKSQISLVARGGCLGRGLTHKQGEGGMPVPARSTEEWWGASGWPLVHTAAVHPCLPCHGTSPASKWFMWSDLLLSVTSDLWTSWNEPRGEGGKVTEGCLKERLHASPLQKAKRIIFHRSSIISTLPGHLVGRKTANWWQPWNKQLQRFLFFSTCR